MNNSIQNIIIITYEMIPYCESWGACQRMYYLAESLVQNNYNVTVVSCKLNNAKNFYNHDINFNQIIIDHPLKNYNSKSGTKQPWNVLNILIRIVKNLIFKIDRIIFNEPNPGTGIFSYFWVRKVLPSIKDYLSTNKVNKIIISGPPFTLFVLIKKLRKHYPFISIIMDYRDPWNLWNNSRSVAYYRERKLLKYANLITVTTDSFCNSMKEIFVINNCETIYNGYSGKLWAKVKENPFTNDRIVISYVGSINFSTDSNRNTVEFFKAYDELPNKNLFEIRFIGVIESPELQKLRLQFPEIRFIERVSTLESLEFMVQSDYLLNIGLSVKARIEIPEEKGNFASKYLISAKLFDYLRSGKRIISINYPDSYEHKFLSDKNAILCSNNKECITNIFNELILRKARKFGSAKDSKYYSKAALEFSREIQNEKFIRLLKKLDETDKRNMFR